MDRDAERIGAWGGAGLDRFVLEVALPGSGAYKGAPDLAERGAARLAHQSGGLGVVGSNPAAPTNKIKHLPQKLKYMRDREGPKRGQLTPDHPGVRARDQGMLRACLCA